MSSYLLDTDVIIWFLRGREDTLSLLNDVKAGGIPCCSALSVVEVIVGEREAEKADTRDFLQALEIVPLGYEESVTAGELIKTYKKKGTTLSFVDAAIAATCIRNGLVLITYNAKHYPMPELRKMNAG